MQNLKLRLVANRFDQIKLVLEWRKESVAAFDLAFAGGPIIIGVAIVVALAMVWGSYFNSDKLAIAASHCSCWSMASRLSSDRLMGV